jgi:hypothetical protein
MATNLLVNQLIPTVAPRLPSSPNPPDALYLDQLNNVLRLYFNQIDSLLGSLAGGRGGRFLDIPYGAFQDTTIQTAPANTAQVMRFNTTDFTNGVTLGSHTASFTASMATTNMTVTVATAGSIYLGMTLTGTGVSAGTLVVSQTSGTAGGVGVYVVSISQTTASTTITGAVQSKLVAQYPGIYNLQWSGQFVNKAAAIHEVSVWLREDGAGAGVDVPGSAGLISVNAKHGSFNGGAIVGWNYFVELQAGEFVELWWSTPDVDAYIIEYPANTAPVRPSTASIIATMSFVSALPT